MALFCLGRKLDPKFVKMVTQYMYLHPLSIFSTIYQKIYYSSFLVCMTRQKSTPNQDLVVSVQVYGLFLLLVGQQNRQSEKEKKK